MYGFLEKNLSFIFIWLFTVLIKELFIFIGNDILPIWVIDNFSIWSINKYERRRVLNIYLLNWFDTIRILFTNNKYFHILYAYIRLKWKDSRNILIIKFNSPIIGTIFINNLTHRNICLSPQKLWYSNWYESYACYFSTWDFLSRNNPTLTAINFSN